MRTLLLPRELFNKRSSQIDVRIGPPVAWRRLKEFARDEQMINYLRLRTYILTNRPALEPAAPRRPSPLEELPVVREVIAPPVSQRLLSTEIGALPDGQRLEQVGDLTVYYAEAGQIPNVLREIGRLRETTFRAEDEGTGKSLDNDSYDEHYVHLFLWNSEREEVIGAYRMGLVPDILRRFGTEGLYTSLLFHYRPGLWERWQHSIELGRAFVRQEYQRQHAPLLTLWRGIFRFVSRRPDYNILFGPLSISRAYSQASKSAIELYARTHLSDPSLAGLVSARNPFRPSRLAGVKAKFVRDYIQDLGDLSSVVSSIEPDGKGIPVLFRQYAKFDFRILAFNVNKYFSSTVDGLMYVDLTRTEAGTIRRLMGAGAYADYASHRLALSR